MDAIMGGLKWQTCLIYLDDIIISSQEFQTQLEDVKQVLQQLQDANLHVNLKRCKFAARELT